MPTKTTKTAPKQAAPKQAAPKQAAPKQAAPKATKPASKAQAQAQAQDVVRKARAKVTAEAMARQAARQAAEELQRAKANEIPEGKRSSISHASNKPIQKLAASTGGKLETEVRAWFKAGAMRPGTKNELARMLADARATVHGKPVNDKAIRSTRESVGRLIDAGVLVLREGVYTV